MHILLVKLSSIGDVVHALPAAAAVRRSFPQARLTWVVEQLAAPVLVGSPVLDEVIVLDTRKWRRRLGTVATWKTAFAQWRALRQVPVDVALDFQGLLKSAGVAWLAGARDRIGFGTTALREPACRWGYTRQVEVDDTVHVISNNLKLAAAIGADISTPPEFPFPDLTVEEAAIRAKLEAVGSLRFAIVNPGGGWVTKLWPPADYARLADWLWEQYGLKSVVTCGPGEAALAEAILAQTRSGSAVFLPTTLREFVVLARQAQLFVGGDTGPLHLAAACRTPIVGLYGPTMPERNGPFAPADETVGREIPCRVNCHRRTCSHHICMEIPLTQVTAAIERRFFKSQAVVAM
ncbi:MAG: lipopolysaccharide heptosyltransferase I [Blastocatellia bacterium]|nr:lipopolysaccharide heptosyltransferase I [Blastocatellia bacterium]